MTVAPGLCCLAVLLFRIFQVGFCPPVLHTLAPGVLLNSHHLTQLPPPHPPPPGGSIRFISFIFFLAPL